MNRIIVFLGGFCAEKLMFGVATPAAQSDLAKANGIANNMVSLYGMGGVPAGLVREHITSDAMKENRNKLDRRNFLKAMGTAGLPNYRWM